ncbi:rfaE bifunctional protein kinase chain/domain [Pedobacter africanus]|uniref:D-beta-D-heptose 7-phosphate kinase/D-beta-D-heptose 1-phosphate adenosyltransferase n=1 Tax=Pedobacter africanus TaxID=151894 RepID=A0ACC6KZZ9_9SPHI|nr:D-glycero-beta-D-manno-heptose-7-phosphate kinase [Pedobacter africanus]MDR6784929.1 D-beta-D-heptose 7-phosphate kinase/D-beta-D-heptose 1-phosphate adenosyltransferase [Pedobacter africanus]
MLTEKLFNAHQNNQAPEILVVGDLMLDHYIFGSANRLSPEAPVPIVNINRESKIIGGAANVASNLVDLGAKVTLAGVVGNDVFASDIENHLHSKEIDTRLIARDSDRQTTVKTRVIAGNHQIVRIDREDTHEISPEMEASFFLALKPSIEEAAIVILSDYNKGLLTAALCLNIIGLCNDLGKKIIVDPKGLDYSKYEGAFVIKPNRKELAEAAKTETIRTDEDLIKAANVILATTKATYLIVTLSEAGIAIITKDSYKIIPVAATEVYDVTGAGDTVVATLAYCLSMGFDIEEAVTVANHAASIVIKHIGSATTNVVEIIASLKTI